MAPDDLRLYRRWVIANAWSEAVGLGTTFALGWTLAPAFDPAPSPGAAVGVAAAAVVVGTLLEGVVVGAAQGAVLAERLPHLRRRWIVATAAGAGLAWLLGMVPSTLVALAGSGRPQSPPTEPPALMQLVLALGLGGVLGSFLGLAQWFALRGKVARAGRWVWINALAWAVGMPLVFVGMDLVPWTRAASVVLPILYAICGACGLVVGSIQGPILVGLCRHGPGARAA